MFDIKDRTCMEPWQIRTNTTLRNAANALASKLKHESEKREKEQAKTK